jgi:hypothetical protein
VYSFVDVSGKNEDPVLCLDKSTKTIWNARLIATYKAGWSWRMRGKMSVIAWCINTKRIAFKRTVRFCILRNVQREVRELNVFG